MASKEPNAKFMTLGKSKFVHVVRTKAWDIKHSTCQQVRKYTVAGKIDYKAKHLSPEAALALDGCEHCATKVVAEGMIPPEEKKAARKDARDDVLKRAKESTQPKKKAAKSKAAKPASDKPRKAPLKTKAGVRSVASRKDGDPTKAKAQMLIDHAVEAGWEASMSTDEATGHIVVTATRGEETITAWYIDGKYDINRHAETRVGSWTGKLRGAHACRRQMSGEGRDRVHPEPGKGRSGPRKKAEEDEVPTDESPEDAMRRVPFLIDDDDVVIIDAIKGRTIKWRNGVSGSLEEAWLPADSKGRKRAKIAITTHPKTGKRMVSFLSVAAMGEDGEVYGPERTVALEKIVRVAG